MAFNHSNNLNHQIKYLHFHTKGEKLQPVSLFNAYSLIDYCSCNCAVTCYWDGWLSERLTVSRECLIARFKRDTVASEIFADEVGGNFIKRLNKDLSW
jgi:hypothetical protein